MQQTIFLGLKAIPFFSDLSDETLNALAVSATTAEFDKNMTILTEGDETTSLYIVLSGKVKVFTSYTIGKDVTLLTQAAGSYFGELALLTNEPRSASVVALEGTTCAIISKNDFMTWLVTHPEVAIDLLSVLSEKVRYLTEKIKKLALSNVYERTVNVLRSMAHEKEGVLIIDKKPTPQALADKVGASEEMINKVMKELIRQGHIVPDNKSLRIEKAYRND